MKRFVCGMLIFITVLILIACGGTDQEMPISENTDASKTDYARIADASENDNMFIEKADTENQNSITNSADFNFDTKTVMLNIGYEMPIYGIGTYSLLDEVCVDSVSAALDRGVRLIDTAYMYHNDVICCEV